MIHNHIIQRTEQPRSKERSQCRIMKISATAKAKAHVDSAWCYLLSHSMLYWLTVLSLPFFLFLWFIPHARTLNDPLPFITRNHDFILVPLAVFLLFGKKPGAILLFG